MTPLAIAWLIILAVVVVYVVGVVLILRWLARRLRPWPRRRAGTLVAMALLLLGWPFAYSEFYRYSHLIGRIPSPLEVAAITFQQDYCGCAGGPGDNGAGYFEFKLKDEGVVWALALGDGLADALPGGEATWRRTPSPFTESIHAFLNTYGPFEIDPSRLAVADQVVHSEGALYRKDRNQVTVIDPHHGRAYYFYVF